MAPVQLKRFDLNLETIIIENEDNGSDISKWCREELISKYNLPSDCIIKLKNSDGHLIPWSMLTNNVEIQIFRPHQNVKPRKSDDNFDGTSLFKEKISRLESRVASLETVINQETIDMKTDRDLQLLTKQITFLGNRLEEADGAEWIKK